MSDADTTSAGRRVSRSKLRRKGNVMSVLTNAATDYNARAANRRIMCFAVKTAPEAPIHAALHSLADAIRFSDFLRTEFQLGDRSTVLVDIGGTFHQKVGTSSINVNFADYALAMVEKLLGAGFRGGDILFASPYAAQRNLYIAGVRQMCAGNIRWALGAKGDLRCTTIDSIQGGEASVVVLGLVATGPDEASSFVQEYRCLNVAISSPMNGLVIIGDSKPIKEETLKGFTEPSPSGTLKKLNRPQLYVGIFARARLEGWLVPATASTTAGKAWWSGYEGEEGFFDASAGLQLDEDWGTEIGDSSEQDYWSAVELAEPADTGDVPK